MSEDKIKDKLEMKKIKGIFERIEALEKFQKEFTGFETSKTIAQMIEFHTDERLKNLKQQINDFRISIGQCHSNLGAITLKFGAKLQNLDETIREIIYKHINQNGDEYGKEIDSLLTMVGPHLEFGRDNKKQFFSFITSEECYEKCKRHYEVGKTHDQYVTERFYYLKGKQEQRKKDVMKFIATLKQMRKEYGLTETIEDDLNLFTKYIEKLEAKLK